MFSCVPMSRFFCRKRKRGKKESWWRRSVSGCWINSVAVSTFNDCEDEERNVEGDEKRKALATCVSDYQLTQKIWTHTFRYLWKKVDSLQRTFFQLLLCSYLWRDFFTRNALAQLEQCTRHISGFALRIFNFFFQVCKQETCEMPKSIVQKDCNNAAW